MQYLIGNFSEFQLATVVTFLLHESVFFLSGIPSLLFERFGLFAKYKIQVSPLLIYLISFDPLIDLPPSGVMYRNLFHDSRNNTGTES
jgi:hypothetical protein